VEGLIRALLQAQAFAAANADQAITITAAAIGIERSTIVEMWPDYAFDVSLDQALIANLEGHWRLAAQSDPTAKMPDFMTDLAPRPLQAADASRVTYLR
jgi:ABC-type nitrate/sulfonate/bicarbonate transport system substrate-binding protein